VNKNEIKKKEKKNRKNRKNGVDIWEKLW